MQRRRRLQQAARGALGRLREHPQAERVVRLLVLMEFLPQGGIPTVTFDEGYRTTEDPPSPTALADGFERPSSPDHSRFVRLHF